MRISVYKTAQAEARAAQLYREVLDAWPVPLTERMVETRHGATFVISCGPENAPPVVLLHGSQANSAAWLPDIEQWAHHFRLHAIDMIGEPGFSAPMRPALDSEAHALWLDDVFAALGLSQAALVGTSLGGWLALDYASRRPGFATSLVLVCPSGIGRQKNFLLWGLPLLLLGRWGANRMREAIFGPRPAVLPRGLAQISALMEHLGAAVKPRIVNIPVLTDQQLGDLAMPILAIVGGRDALLDSRDTRDRLQRHASRAEVCFIEDGYHFLPGQTGRIADFLLRPATA